MEHYSEGELAEMVELYVQRGFDEADARTILEIMSKNRRFFLDHMCQASLPDANSISMWVGAGDTHALDMYIVTAFGGAARLLAQPPSNAYAFSLEDRLFSLLSPEYVAFKPLLIIGVHACTEAPASFSVEL